MQPHRADSLPPDLDLETATVAELGGLLRAGEVTSVALAAAYLARIDALDRAGPALHAVRAVNPAALAEAAAADAGRASAGGQVGPLHGLPVVVKDNVDVAGMPTTAGAVALAASYPPGDAWLVAALRRAGAVILAKANLTEMANFLTDGMPSGYSSLGGQVLNPYDASVTPSGSSAGSAVAVAAGLAPLAVGTETNGSILSPAEACSVVGIKPTVGLVSRTGVLPIAHSQDTAGPMATDVAGAAALLDAMAGPDPDDPTTAAARPPGAFAAAAPGALRGARLGVVDAPVADGAGAGWVAAREILAGCGATLVPVALEPLPDSWFVLTYEFGADLDAYLERLGPGAPVRTRGDLVELNAARPAEAAKFGQSRLLAAHAVDHADPATRSRYDRARRADLGASRGQVDRLLSERRLAALVFPGAASADIGARAGYPSVTVPAGYTAGGARPFGITLLGPAWSEATLVGLAAGFEHAARCRRPPSALNPAVYRATRG